MFLNATLIYYAGVIGMFALANYVFGKLSKEED